MTLGGTALSDDSQGDADAGGAGGYAKSRTAQWAEATDVPDTPDTPDKPDECAVTFRVPDDAFLTILNGVTQDGIVEISGIQEIALPRQIELGLCLTRPNPENGGRISLPFRVLPVRDGRGNALRLRVKGNL